MFIPLRIGVGAGGGQRAGYNRMIETASRFDVLGRRAENMTEPLTAIGVDLHAQMAAAFATQGDSGATGHWTQLSDNPLGHGYRSFKESHVAGVPILVGLKRTGPKGQRPQTYEPSGVMRRELLDPLAMHVTPQRLLYAPTSGIAGWHETGTPTMPARPPVDVTPTFLHSIDRTFVAWFAKLMKESGL